MTDEISIDTDEAEQDFEHLMAGLSFLQITAAEHRDVEMTEAAGGLMNRLIEQNPDIAREAIKNIAKNQYGQISLPIDLAEVLELDPDEWNVFHDPEGETEDMTNINID